jgi:hypothetical protein
MEPLQVLRSEVAGSIKYLAFVSSSMRACREKRTNLESLLSFLGRLAGSAWHVVQCFGLWVALVLVARFYTAELTGSLVSKHEIDFLVLCRSIECRIWH